MKDQEDLIFYKVSLQNYFGIKLLIDKGMFFVSACLFMMQFFKADNLLAALSFTWVIFLTLLKWKGEALNLQQLFPNNFKAKGDFSKALHKLDFLKYVFFLTGMLLSFLKWYDIIDFKF